MARKIDCIVIHCSASTWGTVEEIRRWHVEDRGWRDIGYNGVILNGRNSHGADYEHEKDGRFEEGRGIDLNNLVDQEEIGAHARGNNTKALGICLIGSTDFTVRQIQTALYFCSLFKRIDEGIEVLGHCELPNVHKTCPNINMDKFRHILDMKIFTSEYILETLDNILVG